VPSEERVCVLLPDAVPLEPAPKEGAAAGAAEGRADEAKLVVKESAVLE